MPSNDCQPAAAQGWWGRRHLPLYKLEGTARGSRSWQVGVEPWGRRKIDLRDEEAACMEVGEKVGVEK